MVQKQRCTKLLVPSHIKTVAPNYTNILHNYVFMVKKNSVSLKNVLDGAVKTIYFIEISILEYASFKYMTK